MPKGVYPRRSKVKQPCSVTGCEVIEWARGYCRTHYSRWATHGDPLADVPVRSRKLTATERLFLSVDCNGPLPIGEPTLGMCWTWVGKCNRKGYGIARGGNAHVIAYRLLVGPVPVGRQLHHRCFNKRCVRPDHLETLTPIEHSARHLKTHCLRGHELTPENVYSPPGRPRARCCRACKRMFGDEPRTREVAA
jgi:hypothetical protein